MTLKYAEAVDDVAVPLVINVALSLEPDGADKPPNKDVSPL
jgi:hypothetical protein